MEQPNITPQPEEARPIGETEPQIAEATAAGAPAEVSAPTAQGEEPQPASPESAPAKPAADESWKTIVAVLLLIFVTPVGVIVMWLITQWPRWVKILITVVLPLVISTALLIIGLSLAPSLPTEPISMIL